MIAIDWGTTNFRAFRMDDHGEVLGSRTAAAGLLNVADQDFAGTLRSHVADWLQQGETTILMCGMVGSRYGWFEAPYVRCPAGAAELAGALTPVPFEGAAVWIVPGMETEDAEGVPEIMRGEETAAIGILSEHGPDGLICLPGTHSKWARCERGRVTQFSTFMTGEVFAALRRHTILAQFMRDDSAQDLEIFRRGVDAAGDGSALLHRVFAARTLPLKRSIPEQSAAAYLSGLLIGSEVRSAMHDGAEVVLDGADALCSLYAEAISLCGGCATRLRFDAAARGLWLLAKAMRTQTTRDAHVTA